MGRFVRHLLFSYKSFISNATANLFVCRLHLVLHTLHLCAHWQCLNCTVITSLLSLVCRDTQYVYPKGEVVTIRTLTGFIAYPPPPSPQKCADSYLFDLFAATTLFVTVSCNSFPTW